MDLGPLAACDAVREITASSAVNVMGYCIGGTLLAMTLAWLAAKGDSGRFNVATFMVSMQDFSRVGDTAVFMEEPSIDAIDTLDTYAVGAGKDHIVPWDAAWRITQLFGGKVRYVLASSGHIAGIINPPGGKGTYWTNEIDPAPATAEHWRQTAARHDGSWWTDWTAWLVERSGERAKPPPLGSTAHPPLGDAPGTYVLER